MFYENMTPLKATEFDDDDAADDIHLFNQIKKKGARLIETHKFNQAYNNIGGAEGFY